MHPITNYIKERIETLENKLDTNIDNNTIYPAIAELQAVLSKIEELDSPIYKDEIVIPTYHHYRTKERK